MEKLDPATVIVGHGTSSARRYREDFSLNISPAMSSVTKAIFARFSHSSIEEGS
jgi:hypothetical protein